MEKKYCDYIFNNEHALSSAFIGSDGGIAVDVAQTAQDARKIFDVLKMQFFKSSCRRYDG